MRTGIIVLNVAGLAWLAAALGAVGVPMWAFAVPTVISVALAAFCLSRVPRTAVPRAGERRIARTVGMWSTVQVVMIAIAVFLLVRLERPTLIPPVVALIVGLHFKPLAGGLSVPLYNWTALGLVAVAIASFILPVRPTLATAGFGAAAVLYATSVALMLLPGTAGSRHR